MSDVHNGRTNRQARIKRVREEMNNVKETQQRTIDGLVKPKDQQYRLKQVIAKTGTIYHEANEEPTEKEVEWGDTHKEDPRQRT